MICVKRQIKCKCKNFFSDKLTTQHSQVLHNGGDTSLENEVCRTNSEDVLLMTKIKLI